MIRNHPLLGAALFALAVCGAQAQDDQALKNDAKSTGDVLTYGMGYNHQRFSPLTQINKQNVKRLVPAWSYSLADNRGQEAQPLLKDGVIYLTDHEKTVAVDALTGEGISLAVKQAGALVNAIADDAPASYEAEWHRITRNYRLLTRALVLASTPRPLRRAIVPAGRLLPSAFRLGVNVLAS